MILHFAYFQNNLVSVESKPKNWIYSESQKEETALKYRHESVSQHVWKLCPHRR